MTDFEDIRSLLKDATVASDPRSGGLLDYRDLQQLLARVAAEARVLLEERESLGTRLTRNPTHAIDHPGPVLRIGIGSDGSGLRRADRHQ